MAFDTQLEPPGSANHAARMAFRNLQSRPPEVAWAGPVIAFDAGYIYITFNCRTQDSRHWNSDSSASQIPETNFHLSLIATHRNARLCRFLVITNSFRHRILCSLSCQISAFIEAVVVSAIHSAADGDVGHPFKVDIRETQRFHSLRASDRIYGRTWTRGIIPNRYRSGCGW
jgi:hypothetical protein